LHHEGNFSPPTHENLNTVIENCRRGRTSKTSASKDLLESVEQLTHLSASTREKTFVSYLTEISFIDRETIEHGFVAGPTHGNVTNPTIGLNSGQTQAEVERGNEFRERATSPI
jgi:hypothetical protein